MQAYVSTILNTLTQNILGLTLYETMRSSTDFEDVRATLNDRTAWSIELFRNCFTVYLLNRSYFFTLCTLAFLIMAENIHIHYGRLSPLELKERAQDMGYATFAILFGMLDIAFIVLRIAGLVALAGSPGLATGLVVVGMSPALVFPLFVYPARLVTRRRRGSGGEVEAEAGIGVGGNQGQRPGVVTV
ncbi:hypothetical protein JVU11DRAFT_3141 [Chiua virens]|nr:hypothetical protein JVU11DRAFT_3141 [Chiua virens]